MFGQYLCFLLVFLALGQCQMAAIFRNMKATGDVVEDVRIENSVSRTGCHSNAR